MSYDEVVETELEALEYTYGTALDVLSRDPLRISISIEPFTGEDHARMFVCADLVLSAGEGYPDRVPHLELQNVKGTYPEKLYFR